MQTATTRCAHCDTLIVDPTTQVVHGDKTYCCPNCSAAMEQAGDLRCAHCRAVIVDEATMVTRGDQAYCCSNCAAAMGTHSPTR